MIIFNLTFGCCDWSGFGILFKLLYIKFCLSCRQGFGFLNLVTTLKEVTWLETKFQRLVVEDFHKTNE